MKLHSIILAAALAFTPAAFAQTDSNDIVWPTYSRIVYPNDMKLNCTQLRAEIERVKRDVRMLEHAQERVEVALRSGFDMDMYRGDHSAGGVIHVGNGGGEQTYSRARADIMVSLRVAHDRLAHLNTLTLICER